MDSTKELKILAWVILAFGLAACETSNNHALEPPYGQEPTAMYLEIMGERYEVPLSSDKNLNLRTLTTEFPVECKVLNYADRTPIHNR